MKLNEKQAAVLKYLSAHPHRLCVGRNYPGARGFAGSTLASLVRRDLVTCMFNGFLNFTEYRITDAGRAALAKG